MQWSKLKTLIESRLCDSLKGRIKFYSTRYRGTHDQVGKAWITFDNEIAHDFCTIKRSYKCQSMANSIRQENNCLDWEDPEQKAGYYNAYKIAEEEMIKQGLYYQHDFYSAVEDFLNQSITDSLKSENSIIRALSYLDGRVGKRTLSHIKDENDITAKKFLIIRLKAEGMFRER